MQIHELQNSTSVFASDDFLMVSGPTNNTRKMSKDAVLEQTATNTLKNNVAPEFDSTVAYTKGQFVTYQGKIYQFTSDHSAGAWNASHATVSGQNALLKMTAQNALAGNIAPEFDPTRTSENPYKVGDVVVYQGTIYSFVVAHYGHWEASHAVRANEYMMQAISLYSSNIDSFSDANNFPANSVIRCSSELLSSQVLNTPIVGDQFTIYTYGAGSILYQVGIVASIGNIFFRRKWSSWSSWLRLSETIKNNGTINSTKAQTSPYNDLNSFPLNEIGVYISSYSYVQNKPTNESFEVACLGATDGAKIQIVSTSSKTIYFRAIWSSSWSNWISLHESVLQSAIANDFSTSKDYKYGERIIRNGSLLRAVKNISAGNDYNPSDWIATNLEDEKYISINESNVTYINDADNFPMDSVVSCLNYSVAAQVSHLPKNEPFGCYTFRGGRISAVAMQLAIDSATNEIYFRRLFSSWSAWERLAFASDIKKQGDGTNPLCCYDNIVAVGDSLTYCQVYTSSSSSRESKRKWADILANYCGATAQTIAHAGDTAASSWTRVESDLVAKTNALMIVYLGTNYGLTDTLSTDAPTDTPYEQWANTNTGCYAKIVAKAQSLGYKVMLIKPFTTGGSGGASLEDTHKTIDDIGTRFGCAVVEPFRNTDLKYHYYPDFSGYNTLHYNDLGYSWFATMLINYVTNLGADNLKFIIPS